MDLAYNAQVGGIVLPTLVKNFGRAADDSQQIVEVMRDAARQPAHGLHLLPQPHLFIELPFFRDVAAQVGHAGKPLLFVEDAKDARFYQDWLSGDKMAHGEFTFPDLPGTDEGKDLLFQDGALGLTQEVKSRFRPGFLIAAQPYHFLAGSIQKEHSALQVGNADKVRAILQGGGEAGPVPLALLAFGDVHQHAREAYGLSRFSAAFEK